jgi:fructosamine-3-kinase
MQTELRQALEIRFPGTAIELQSANGQGNHRTFRVRLGKQEGFVRIEDGPECDNYFDVESLIIEKVGLLGIPVSRVIASDCSRTVTPFAWQMLEYIPQPDLNRAVRGNRLPLDVLMGHIGEAVAGWQNLRFPRFGPFSAELARNEQRLQPLHETYAGYYRLNLDRHLDFLLQRNFLSHADAERICAAIESNASLLNIPEGCLVHKDLALWNILGSSRGIAAFVDWDDTISGDPMDDLSLLGCFYDGVMLQCALEGYASVRPLPEHYHRRFWLHMLRNMLVKAVIRVGAGYFTRDGSFFLIGSDSGGADLETETRTRLLAAVDGLNENKRIESL